MMSKPETGRVEVTVMPMRFTDHFSDMREFLAVLGFSPRVSRDGKWLTMVGASGMVALHEAASSGSGPGDTGLCFQVADADGMAAQFAAAGFTDITIYDEAYGRVVRVEGPEDTSLSLDESPRDLYGYEIHEPRPEHGIMSMPVLFRPPVNPLDRLLSAAGFVRLDEGDDEWWRVWRGTGGGLIAVHPPGDDNTLDSVRLGFRTEESLPELAERLTAAGYAGVAVSDDFGGELTVTDPDGQKVLVQPAAGDRHP